MNISPHLALASWGMILLVVMAVKRLVGARGLIAGFKRARVEVIPSLPLERK
jgi:hypothetical protein